MDERLRFIARLLEGETMSSACREFGISRVTGCKIFSRYKECGLVALCDRSRHPYRHTNRLPFQVERSILGLKREHPTWGAPKIRDKLIRDYPMIKPPAISTVHAVLDRNGLVKRRKRRRYKAEGLTVDYVTRKAAELLMEELHENTMPALLALGPLPELPPSPWQVIKMAEIFDCPPTPLLILTGWLLKLGMSAPLLVALPKSEAHSTR